jgi:hypothetical protein
MDMPNGELDAILRSVDHILGRIRENEAAAIDAGTDVLTLAQALEQLADVMSRVENDTRATGGHASADDITEIGAYALQLQEALANAARQQSLDDLQQPLALLAIDMALWIAYLGGRIESLEPVADAIALVANNSRDPRLLGQLSHAIGNIITAVSPLIREDLEKMNPGRPWRVLLLNHGIVATRSHDTALMEAAFTLLTTHLPEDATQFFSEGMQQMEALDYPPQVREVMQKYHRQWPENRSLH